MNSTNNKMQEKEELIKDENNFSAIHGKSIKSNSQNRQEMGITCTIKQFLTFDRTLSHSTKMGIVRSQMPNDNPKNKPTGYTWYREAIKPIKESIISSSSTPIITAISELKNQKYDPLKGKMRYDIPNCIDALMRFDKIKMPEPFNYLRKTEIKLKEKTIVINGITIKLKPDLIFTAKLNGMNVVGAVLLIARKENPLGSLQLKMGAHLIHEFLLAHRSNFEGEIRRELCIYIDIVHHKVVIAPDLTASPNREIRELCNSFADLWNQELKSKTVQS